jgi:hypothetical protein
MPLGNDIDSCPRVCIELKRIWKEYLPDAHPSYLVRFTANLTGLHCG